MDHHDNPDELELRVPISKEQEKQFLEVPFEMQPGVDALRVSMAAVSKSDETTIIDLGLRDGARVRGWSGGARRELYLAADTATPGYLPGKLESGQWAVLLGIYQVPVEGCTVYLTIASTRAKPRWFKGDLHVHSIHSDGVYSLEEIAAKANKAGLDFIALTDHNTSSQNYFYPRHANVLFIPGMELTTYQGHVNLFGVHEPLDDFRASTQDELAQRLTLARGRGAYISLNHPHDLSCPSCHWQWGWDAEYDWIEVWNGPWRPSNAATLDWWQQQLVSGRRLVIVGGSDTHRPDPYVRHGTPTNWVYAPRFSAEGILWAISQGHLFLSYAPDGPRIDLRCGEYVMGDVAQSLDEVRVSCTGLMAGDDVRLVSHHGVVRQERIEDRQSQVRWTVPPGDSYFYRMEIWRHFPEANQRLLAALSNPLYFQRE